MEAPFEVERDDAPHAVIKVIGVGGGGTNAVDSMIKAGLDNVDYWVVNTDAQALSRSLCSNRIQIGKEITNGLGSGGDPAVGERSAESAKEDLKESIDGADMVFLTAGLGGGTGTGAAPIIAQIAKEMNTLCVAIMTKPFRFEGPQRMRKAMQGIERLREYVDTMILISNDRLLEVIDRSATLLESFNIANKVLCQGVESISDLITVPGLINVDFADVRTIMGETGGAVMGIGVGRGEHRAVEAVNKACSSPLLDKIVIDGARGVLMCIAGGPDLTLFEVNEATTLVYEKADPEANIIFGAVIDENLKDEIRVTIIATGFAEEEGPLQRKAEKESEQPLQSPTSPISLKAKLESMMGPEKEERRQESNPESKAPAEEKPEGSNDSEPKSEQLEASSDKAETSSNIRKQPFEIELDTEDRELNKSSIESKNKDETEADENESMDDLSFDTPAYLRKKDLLD